MRKKAVGLVNRPRVAFRDGFCKIKVIVLPSGMRLQTRLCGSKVPQNRRYLVLKGFSERGDPKSVLHKDHVTYSLNSLEGGYIRDCIGII